MPVKWTESARERARNWDKEWRKARLEKRTGRKKKKKEKHGVFKCRKAAWHQNRHAPSHNSQDINFSTLSVPPRHHSLSLLFSFLPSALPLHLASSLSLTSFPLFYSFIPFSHHFSSFSVCTILSSSSSSPSFLCNWIVLSLLCVFLNLSLFSTWQHLHLCYRSLRQLRLLPLFPSDFSLCAIKGNLFLVQPIFFISRPSKW